MAAIVAACKNRFDSEVTECEVELTDPGGREVVTLTLHAPGAMIELPMERSDAVEIWKEIGAALGLPGLPEKPG